MSTVELELKEKVRAQAIMAALEAEQAFKMVAYRVISYEDFCARMISVSETLLNDQFVKQFRDERQDSES